MELANEIGKEVEYAHSVKELEHVELDCKHYAGDHIFKIMLALLLTVLVQEEDVKDCEDDLND